MAMDLRRRRRPYRHVSILSRRSKLSLERQPLLLGADSSSPSTTDGHTVVVSPLGTVNAEGLRRSHRKGASACLLRNSSSRRTCTKNRFGVNRVKCIQEPPLVGAKYTKSPLAERSAVLTIASSRHTPIVEPSLNSNSRTSHPAIGDIRSQTAWLRNERGGILKKERVLLEFKKRVTLLSVGLLFFVATRRRVYPTRS